jgi:hypothetical protein
MTRRTPNIVDVIGGGPCVAPVVGQYPAHVHIHFVLRTGQVPDATSIAPSSLARAQAYLHNKKARLVVSYTGDIEQLPRLCRFNCNSLYTDGVGEYCATSGMGLSCSLF